MRKCVTRPTVSRCGSVSATIRPFTASGIPSIPSRRCRPSRPRVRPTRNAERIPAAIAPLLRRFAAAFCGVSLFIRLIRCCGHSIGGFDLDKIQGDRLVLGIGRAGEPYEGIGRGELNIEGMPVYRDMAGGVGTPTSDNERTKISAETSRLLAIINAYSGEKGLEDAVGYMTSLLEEFAEAKNIKVVYFK